MEAMDILNKMKEEGFTDSKITQNIDYVFKNLSVN